MMDWDMGMYVGAMVLLERGGGGAVGRWPF